jgi:hypothetical protein
MKKTALSLALILALLISALFVIGVANSAPPQLAIPTGPLTPPTISMESPASTTYVSWFVPLKFSVNGNWNGYVDHCNVEFSLDGAARYVVYDPPMRTNAISQDFSINLGPLSEGNHQLQVYATVGGVYRVSPNSTTLAANDFTSQTSVSFTVNTADQAHISILSPQNETYNSNKEIPVEFTVNSTGTIDSMGFNLDDHSNVTIPRNTTLYGPIPDGVHTLKVYSVFTNIMAASSTVNFTVDTTAPNVSILSIQDKTYNTSKIPLDFTVNETASMITYIMDGKVSTIYGNATLTGLINGNHTITVYATDQAGNAGASELIDFNVQVPIPPQIAFAVLPPMAIVLIGGLTILIYLEKRKQSAAHKQ